MRDQKRIVIVLGAGASAPYGFPLGETLLSEIRGTSYPTKLFEGLGITSDQVEEFRRSLAGSTVSSIDRFLELRPEHSKPGKALLAWVLSEAEFRNDLYSERSAGRWYRYLFDEFIIRGSFEELFNGIHISVLTFNYDRSLDYWLLGALRERFNKNEDECRKQLQKLDLIHLHGTLGGTPLTSASARAYGAIKDHAALASCLDDILVIHESARISAPWARAHELLNLASAVVFLGFGYNRLNLERLGIDRNCRGRHRRSPTSARWAVGNGVPDSAVIYGTRRGMTNSEVSAKVLPLIGSPQDLEHGEHSERDVLEWLRNHVDYLTPPV
jgi:hypothetical protein